MVYYIVLYQIIFYMGLLCCMQGVSTTTPVPRGLKGSVSVLLQTGRAGSLFFFLKASGRCVFDLYVLALEIVDFPALLLGHSHVPCRGAVNQDSWASGVTHSILSHPCLGSPVISLVRTSTLWVSIVFTLLGLKV